MKHLLALGLLIGYGLLLAQPEPATVTLQEIPRYTLPAGWQWLELGYASAKLRGPLPDTTGIVVDEVSLVFTRYPLNPNTWRHPFGQLLRNRYSALYQVLPQAFAPAVVWSWTLQTRCTTEAQTMRLPHGFAIRYHYKNNSQIVENLPKPIIQPSLITPETKPIIAQEVLDLMLHHPMRSAAEVAEIVSGSQPVKDSTVLNTLLRHPEWHDMLVVMDWTSSMYHYGASALLWHKLNMEQRKVLGFTFFNDGDYRPDSDKITPGKVGGVYHCSASSIDSVMLLMERVMRAGDGGDLPENDLEAVQKGIRRFPQHGDVVLIADNTSDVRDLSLLTQLNVPVHIILCGPEFYPAHPHYLLIARMTGGTIHTLTEDIADLSTQTEGATLTIGRFRYQLINGRWKAVNKQ